MLKGRLGLETARVPHADRHGLVWLSMGELCVIDGGLAFRRGEGTNGGSVDLVPHQAVSAILIGPGSSVTHDALRLLARHGSILIAVGVDGVRCYTAPPLSPDRSDLAREQASRWAVEKSRLKVARQMYAIRLGEILPHREIETLRGIEGARMKATYRLLAERYGVEWRGRNFDRSNPAADDLPNQAINHASTCVYAAAAIAVQATATLPQLGFIHEDSGHSFVLDIADLFRDSITLPIAFGSAKIAESSGDSVDRIVRREANRVFRRQQLIPSMIDRIKQLFEAGRDGADDRRHA